MGWKKIHKILRDPGGAIIRKASGGEWEGTSNLRGALMPWADKKAPPKDMSAAEMEAERQARISGNVAQINNAYAGREKQYADYANAIREKYTNDLTKQYTGANRNLKFELAGAGLTGGSYAKDAGKDLANEMTQGTLAAESKAGEAESALRGQDENTRLQLISLAQTGGDIGNPAIQAGNMLKANLQSANSTAGQLGDVFGSTAQAYKQLQDARNLRRGLTTSYEQIYGAGIGRAQPTR